MGQTTIADKMKQMIDLNYVNKFDVETINQLCFIPVTKQKDTFFAIIKKSSNQENVEKKILEITGLAARFILFQDEQYKSLYEYYVQIAKVSNKNTQSTAQTMSKPEQAPKKRLGDLLKEAGYVNEQQLMEALVYGKTNNIPIGSALVEKGYITVDILKNFLQEQQGNDLVEADQLKVQPDVLKLLPVEFIKTNKVIPLSSDGKTIVVGMVNTNNKKVLNELVYITGGLRPQAKLVTHYEYKKFVEQHFGENYKETTEIIKNIEQEQLEYDVEESLFDQVEKELQDKSGNVAKFVNKIITNAIDQKASDIHIEPRLEGYVVRYRIDGILRQVLSLPAKVESAVITRFKVLAKMNIAEYRRPQDGTFFIKYNNISYDFRINTLPVGNREKMVIRVLAPAQTLSVSDKEIKLAGATQEELAVIKKMTSMPNGIILASGPTGSGKTTTLYSVLKSVNDPSVNITTIEDPVEIKIDGINQSQINVKAGITFASCMRAILRQDPDIILVGEIRDMETLETAISAALTGHLVLSTIHTNSAATTVTRLIEMGAKDYLVSSTLTGVIAQRLVRKLCPHCKEAYHASLEETQKVILNPDDYEEFMSKEIYRPTGCTKCNFEGFVGRIGVYEILPITKEIKKLIAQGAHDIEIEETAIGGGMNTLQQSCMGHILRGDTTISEFVRVLGLVNE